MTPILIASCSNRKTKLDGEKVAASQLIEGSYTQVAEDWRVLIKNSQIRCPVDTLYCGRGAQEISRAVAAMRGDLWFVSAGLGLIKSTQHVPSYDLTVSKGSDAYIGNKINCANFDPKKWWNALGSRNGAYDLASIVKKSSPEVIIFAMPTAYFNMISQSLDILTLDELSNIRIIGPKAHGINQRYLTFLMPYDERLNSPESPLRGTRSDFPQRAAHHFVKYILIKNRGADNKRHSKMVIASLSHMQFPEIIQRQRVADLEIMNLIIKNWSPRKGKSAMTLRMLRDKELIACEQKRFTKISNQVKRQMDK
jgi:hypothetical protein